jgi:hypothetical protein
MPDTPSAYKGTIVMANRAGFFSARIDDVRRILRKLRKGEQPTSGDTDDLQWFKRTVGLDRPIEDYSERSQRRIFQRLGEGAMSKKDVERREYQARKDSNERSREEHGMRPGQWKYIAALRNKIVAYGMDVEPYMDDEVLKDFAELYGYNYLKTVLTRQIESTEAYIGGSLEPGHSRWNARGELESQFGASQYVEYVRGTDPYYFYHGRRS